MASPVMRTQGFFAFSRAWHSHWPFSTGEELPDYLARPFCPFVPVWLQLEPGITMLLDPYDMVTSHMLTHGSWESSTWHELERHVPLGGTFVDVGAHVGWFSLKAAKAVGPKGRVIAVEPNHETLRRLRDNVRASNASAVITIAPVACADSETTLTFYAAPHANTGESSLSSANASYTGAVTASYQVRARRLADVVREAGVARVDVLKIDVEGAEFLALKGASEILARFRPVVVVELIDEQLKSMGSSAEEVKAFMRSHGYEQKHGYDQNVEFVPLGVPVAHR
jgi:FkbM family methyltransferase